MNEDSKTKAFVKLWGSGDVPTAQVSHGSLRPGTYPAFALLGWLEARKGWPIVGLRLALVPEHQRTEQTGLTMGLVVSPKTERHVCSLLQDLGWDGRVWPYKDHGWPEGTQDETPMLGLLKTAKLGATLVFRPDPEKGVPTVPIWVGRRNGPFLTAPFGEITTVKYLEELRALATDQTPFKSDWC
jgi:hypothetical protein